MSPERNYYCKCGARLRPIYGTRHLPGCPKLAEAAMVRTEHDRYLARIHENEDIRSGLYIVPRRPNAIAATAIHPACKAAYADGAHPCGRCLPLLYPAVCECEPCLEWWAQAEDEG